MPRPSKYEYGQQNVTPLALSSAEKSVTYKQTNKQKHTQNSKRYIHTLPIDMCR